MKNFLIRNYTLVPNIIYWILFISFGLKPALIFMSVVILFMVAMWLLANSTHRRYHTLKSIYWLAFRQPELVNLMERKFSPLITYPMLIWIAFEAEKSFLHYNNKDFRKVVTDKIGELIASMRESLHPKPKPACRFIGIEFTDLDEDEYDFIEKMRGGNHEFSAN